MDLYQLTLAAHQDLDSYLALSASSLPYNLAHAIGNVVFCLLIGPVFIRALRRYRRRLEVRWPAAAGIAATLLLALLLRAARGRGAGRPRRVLARGPRTRTAASAPPRARRSSRLYTGWAALGMASAGHNPRDLHRRGGRSVAAYTKRDARSVTDIGEIERTVLVLSAAGLSPRDFGGRDLIAAILAKRRGNGSIAGYVSYTAFGILALRSAGVSPGKRTVAWLVGAQNDDGGFAVAPNSTSDSDMTGATVQALAVVGRQRGAATSRAVGWLRANQNDDGGYGQFKGRASNAQSTAYAVQGLLAAGAGGATLTRALGYLRGLQHADGSVAYSATSNQTPVWVTAQALMAFERRPLPIAAVPRERRKRSSPKPAAAAPAPAAPAKDEPKPEARQASPATPARRASCRSRGRPPREEALRVDRTGDAGEQDDSGLPWWAFVAAGLGALAVVLAFRRKLVPALWHSQRRDA